MRAVEAILSMRSELESPDEQTRASGLRVVSNAEEPQLLIADPEVKAILDDMRRRYRVMHARLENESDTPDAA